MPISVFNRESKHLPAALAQKCPQIIEKFEKCYGSKPDFVSRSPGRVNLIGEHIDYCDFSVLPLAIDVDMLLAVKILQNKHTITLNNNDPRFETRKFEFPQDGSYVEIDPSVSDWSNYFKCGLRVAHEFIKSQNPEKYTDSPLIGMEVFCLGDVPTGSGLSSSAAFICAIALAVIRANLGSNYEVSKGDLTRITVVAEHFVGVNNGGMDQAASICGKEDHALYVEFKPEFKATAFKFPQLKSKEVGFVIANTLVVSNKAETAPTNYNLRVVEVTIAADMLAAKYNVTLNTAKGQKPTLRNFMDAYYAEYHNNSPPWDGQIASGIKRLTEMLTLVENCFKDMPNGYTTEQASSALNMSPEKFASTYLTMFPVKFQTLKLYQRSKHVYSEALRVLKALELMTTVTYDTDDQFFTRFGDLMNQSQESCNKLFECSCPETDKICEIALNNGSYGSRLTGAGWGGCTVHLVPVGQEIENVKTALIEQYYKKKFPSITQEQIDEAIIVSKPTIGSCLYEL